MTVLTASKANLACCVRYRLAPRSDVSNVALGAFSVSNATLET